VQASTRPTCGRSHVVTGGLRRRALAAPDLATKYGAAGRDWMRQSWRWDQRAA
jgi:hypothetical protein